MKKIISCVLVVLMIFSICSTECFAVSITAGDDALKDQFAGGKAGAHDYVYFSPVEDENDTTKYPLFVWFHGKNSGFIEGGQLNTTEIYNWSSDEYQSRFVDAGGSFMLLPRAKANASVWSDGDVSTLKNTIDAFIELHRDNIDTSRIYAAGNSSGGLMTYKMIAKYPNFFAAALLPAAVYDPSDKELDSIKNMPVWLFANTKDKYSLSRADATKEHFDYLSSIADDPSLIRMTTCTKAVWGDLSQPQSSHYIWGTVTNDMFMDDGTQYAYTETVDGSGQTIEFTFPNGVINWLSQQNIADRKNSSATTSFFEKIANFFKILSSWFASFFR